MLFTNFYHRCQNIIPRFGMSHYLICRTAFRREDPGHGLCIQGVRSQTIDRLCRKGDEIPPAQAFRRLCNRCCLRTIGIYLYRRRLHPVSSRRASCCSIEPFPARSVKRKRSHAQFLPANTSCGEPAARQRCSLLDNVEGRLLPETCRPSGSVQDSGSSGRNWTVCPAPTIRNRE